MPLKDLDPNIHGNNSRSSSFIGFPRDESPKPKPAKSDTLAGAHGVVNMLRTTTETSDLYTRGVSSRRFPLASRQSPRPRISGSIHSRTASRYSGSGSIRSRLSSSHATSQEHLASRPRLPRNHSDVRSWDSLNHTSDSGSLRYPESSKSSIRSDFGIGSEGLRLPPYQSTASHAPRRLANYRSYTSLRTQAPCTTTQHSTLRPSSPAWSDTAQHLQRRLACTDARQTIQTEDAGLALFGNNHDFSDNRARAKKHLPHRPQEASYGRFALPVPHNEPISTKPTTERQAETSDVLDCTQIITSSVSCDFLDGESARSIQRCKDLNGIHSLPHRLPAIAQTPKPVITERSAQGLKSCDIPEAGFVRKAKQAFESKVVEQSTKSDQPSNNTGLSESSIDPGATVTPVPVKRLTRDMIKAGIGCPSPDDNQDTSPDLDQLSSSNFTDKEERERTSRSDSPPVEANTLPSALTTVKFTESVNSHSNSSTLSLNSHPETAGDSPSFRDPQLLASETKLRLDAQKDGCTSDALGRHGSLVTLDVSNQGCTRQLNETDTLRNENPSYYGAPTPSRSGMATVCAGSEYTSPKNSLDSRFSPLKYCRFPLPGLIEDSHEESSTTNLRLLGARPKGQCNSVGSQTGPHAFTSTDKEKTTSASPTYFDPDPATRDELPSLRFSQHDLTTKLNVALGFKRSHSQDKFAQADTIDSRYSPNEPSITFPLRQKYRSFFPLDSHVTLQSPDSGLVRYSHQEDIVQELQRLSIPSVSALTVRLSEIMPGLHSISSDPELSKRWRDADDHGRDLNHLSLPIEMNAGAGSAHDATTSKRRNTIAGATPDDLVNARRQATALWLMKDLPPLPKGRKIEDESEFLQVGGSLSPTHRSRSSGYDSSPAQIVCHGAMGNSMTARNMRFGEHAWYTDSPSSVGTFSDHDIEIARSMSPGLRGNAALIPGDHVSGTTNTNTARRYSKLRAGKGRTTVHEDASIEALAHIHDPTNEAGGNRYPTSGLLPPAHILEGEAHSHFSDDSSDLTEPERRGSFRRRLTKLRSRTPTPLNLRKPANNSCPVLNISRVPTRYRTNASSSSSIQMEEPEPTRENEEFPGVMSKAEYHTRNIFEKLRRWWHRSGQALLELRGTKSKSK